MNNWEALLEHWQTCPGPDHCKLCEAIMDFFDGYKAAQNYVGTVK